MLNEKSLFKEEQREKEEEILSPNEATKFLYASKSFMYKMTSQKIIPHYIPEEKGSISKSPIWKIGCLKTEYHQVLNLKPILNVICQIL
jgi:hypothetical protein